MRWKKNGDEHKIKQEQHEVTEGVAVQSRGEETESKKVKANRICRVRTLRIP